MKQLILIIAIVISGMLAQAQEEAVKNYVNSETRKVIKTSFEDSFNKSENAKAEISFGNDLMILDITSYNPEIQTYSDEETQLMWQYFVRELGVSFAFAGIERFELILRDKEGLKNNSYKDYLDAVNNPITAQKKTTQNKKYYAPNEVEPGESNVEYKDGKITLGGNVTNSEKQPSKDLKDNSKEKTKKDPKLQEYNEKIKDGRLDRNKPVSTSKTSAGNSEDKPEDKNLNLLEELKTYFKQGK